MNILSKGSKLYSILNYKCPRCHEGKVFSSHSYNLKRMFEHKETCDECGLRFEREPGFFYGAMYVSYGYTIAIAVATYFVMEAIYDPGIWEILGALVTALIISSPFIFRLSRITWMNLFVKYNPQKRFSKFS